MSNLLVMLVIFLSPSNILVAPLEIYIMSDIYANLPISIPLVVLDNLDLSKSELNTINANQLVLGEKKEIDIQKLASDNIRLATKISNFWLANSSIWNENNNTQSYNKKNIKRKIYYNKMIDNKTIRTDLREEINSFRNLPLANKLVKEILSVNPNFDEIIQKYSSLEVELLSDDKLAKSVVISFSVKGKEAWPDILGGAPSPAEKKRFFKMYISYAPWRDRRNRRLNKIEIYALEEWFK